MDEGNMYFSADYRHELTITSLKGCISKIEGSGNNAFAKAILDDLKKVLAGLTECDKQIEDLWSGKTLIESEEQINKFIESLKSKPAKLDNEWKLPILVNII